MFALTALATFLASALLFSVQPLLGRSLLPLLGGVPAVWNTCMVFFQASVLLGCLWTHGVSQRSGRSPGLAPHAVLLVAAAASLPPTLSAGRAPSSGESPVAFVLIALAVRIGLPALALAASAPLFARWCSCRRRSGARDPYGLYAAGNAGALVALLAYPTLVEPTWGLAQQYRLWSWGFLAFVLLALAAGLGLRRGLPRQPTDAADALPDGDGFRSERSRQPSAGALRWMLLAAVPATCLLGVTQHLATDITSFPLLWVGPLALYLGSFVLAFGRWGPRATRLADAALPVALLAAVALLGVSQRGTVLLQVGVHGLAFALAAMACHGRLAACRPPPSRLTAYFLWVSLGGLLGGAFVALLAPVVFHGISEYPLALLALAVLRIDRTPDDARATARGSLGGDALQALAVAAAGWAGLVLSRGLQLPGLLLGMEPAAWVLLLPPLLVALLAMRRPRALAFSTAVLLALPWALGPAEQVLHRDRTFFGRHQVLRQPYGQGAFHQLVDGTTVHGVQYDSPPWADLPLSYYGSASPIADVFAALAAGGEPRRVAVVGLGVGSLALQGRPGWQMTFYEVDPAIAAIARDPALFTCLARSPAEVEVLLGDGRLGLEASPPARFDLIVLDAFSSESVPMHLLTVEAIRADLERLAPGGLLAFHVTNVSLSLAPVLAAAAERLGAVALARERSTLDDVELLMQQSASAWVVLARSRDDIDPQAFAGWSWLAPLPGRRAWTDDHASLLSALR